MCEASHKWIFCSCENDSVNKGDLTAFKWTLYRVVGARKNLIRGKMVPPKSDLGKKVTLETVVSEMNARNCFDFDYRPQENDYFYLSNGLMYPDNAHFYLKFKNGEWAKGGYPFFGPLKFRGIAEGGINSLK